MKLCIVLLNKTLYETVVNWFQDTGIAVTEIFIYWQVYSLTNTVSNGLLESTLLLSIKHILYKKRKERYTVRTRGKRKTVLIFEKFWGWSSSVVVIRRTRQMSWHSCANLIPYGSLHHFTMTTHSNTLSKVCSDGIDPEKKRKGTCSLEVRETRKMRSCIWSPVGQRVRKPEHDS